jgi:hypothetical protein
MLKVHRGATTMNIPRSLEGIIPPPAYLKHASPKISRSWSVESCHRLSLLDSSQRGLAFCFLRHDADTSSPWTRSMCSWTFV